MSKRLYPQRALAAAAVVGVVAALPAVYLAVSLRSGRPHAGRVCRALWGAAVEVTTFVMRGWSP